MARKSEVLHLSNSSLGTSEMNEILIYALGHRQPTKSYDFTLKLE